MSRPDPHPLTLFQPERDKHAMAQGRDPLTAGAIRRVLQGVPDDAQVSVWQPEDERDSGPLWQVKAAWDNTRSASKD